MKRAGPGLFDLLLILISLPAAVPALVVGGAFMVPREEAMRRAVRWRIGFAIVAVAAGAGILVTASGIVRVACWVLLVGCVARLIVEMRSAQSRERVAAEDAAARATIRSDAATRQR